MTKEDASVAGDFGNTNRAAKQQRNLIAFPEDNTELCKKNEESKNSSALEIRKSPLTRAVAYVGLNLTREHAVTSVLTRLLPIPNICVRTFSDLLDAGAEVTVIISECKAGYVLGYAHITSPLLGRHAVHSAFSGAAADICEVTWIKFGEFSKNILAKLPAIGRSHPNGTNFPAGLGAEIIRLMDGCAHQHSLPSPVTVASNWRERMTVRSAQPGMHNMMAHPQGSFGVHGGLRRPARMPDDLPPPKRPRHGIAPRRGEDQGGFISRHGTDHPPNGSHGRHTIPPAILAVLGDAPVMQEQPTARKRLVELSYEEYIEVYGRIEEEWHRRQLKQAYINSGLHVKGAGQLV